MSDRALSSGISIPQWMRGSGKSSSGFDPSTLSPPGYDDDFFQIRYTTAQKKQDISPNPCHPRPRGVDDGFHGAKSECASSVVAVAQRMLRGQPPHQRQRRNSKSLPASPLVWQTAETGSPETRRRLGNRFFTLEENKDQGSSTSSILDAITREPEIRAKSHVPESLPKNDTLTPKPSEYREMNFWSPTSM